MMTPGEHADQVLSRYMAERGLKHTRQRSLIVETFFAGGGHLSVDEILATVQRDDARVSVATVYRTMKLLSDCGLAHARDFGDGSTRYEPAAGRHHHGYGHGLEVRAAQGLPLRGHARVRRKQEREGERAAGGGTDLQGSPGRARATIRP